MEPSNPRDTQLSGRRNRWRIQSMQFLFELFRLLTFRDSPNNTEYSALVLAQQGFIYYGGDLLNSGIFCRFCSFCLSIIRCRTNRDIEDQHRRSSPNCPILTGQECGNIPFGEWDGLFSLTLTNMDQSVTNETSDYLAPVDTLSETMSSNFPSNENSTDSNSNPYAPSESSLSMSMGDHATNAIPVNQFPSTNNALENSVMSSTPDDRAFPVPTVWDVAGSLPFSPGVGSSTSGELSTFQSGAGQQPPLISSMYPEFSTVESRVQSLHNQSNLEDFVPFGFFYAGYNDDRVRRSFFGERLWGWRDGDVVPREFARWLLFGTQSSQSLMGTQSRRSLMVSIQGNSNAERLAMMLGDEEERIGRHPSIQQSRENGATPNAEPYPSNLSSDPSDIAIPSSTHNVSSTLGDQSNGTPPIDITNSFLSNSPQRNEELGIILRQEIYYPTHQVINLSLSREAINRWMSEEDLRESPLNLEPVVDDGDAPELRDNGGAQNLTDEERRHLLTLEKVILKKKVTCHICLEGELETLFLPCGHVNTCNECGSRAKVCIICKTPIKSIAKIYLS